jgi:U3 small nucleolar RNA-associated protein 22
MDSNPPKRRKLDHAADDAELALAAAAAASAGLTSRSATFVLETEELLDSVCPDYDSAFSGADELLHRIKGLIEGIEAHDQLQVRLPNHSRLVHPIPSRTR